jgi:hypothetical protein
MSLMSSSMIDISMRLNSVELVSFCRLSINSRVIENGKIPIAVLFVNTLSAWESIYGDIDILLVSGNKTGGKQQIETWHLTN